MSAECEKCGFDLVGSQYDERGLWCVPCDLKSQLAAALEALEEAQAFRAELVELVDGDDSVLADQIRDLMLNLDEGLLRSGE